MNLPMMNWRRLIGFESSVIAVFPSISSATVELAVSSASRRQTNEIVVSPVSLYILMSSPNVKYDTKIDQNSHGRGDERQDEERRLADRLLGGGQRDGEGFHGSVRLGEDGG